MRSTLFFIPHEIAGIPLFGFGWALAAWILGSLAWAFWNAHSRKMATGSSTKETTTKQSSVGNEILTSLPVLGFGAILIVVFLPRIEQFIPGPQPVPLGLPIRGYGVMVLLGLLCGIGITIARGKRLGLSSDLIVSLGFWMMIAGVLGARIFYVIQKWPEFTSKASTYWDLWGSVFALTEGGLVIYGGVLGGAFGCVCFCALKKLPIRAMSDLIAPAFLIGYSFGRIGCLLNGCCYGGVCTANLPTIEFPQGSGPYIDQLANAKLLGIELKPNTRDAEHRLPATVDRVAEGSLAEKMGVTPGSSLNEVDFYQIPRKADDDPAAPPYIEAYVKFDDKTMRLASETLPPYSLPVHPSQIYAALNAALLCWLIWKLQPVASHDGLTFLIAVFLYGVSRFVLEGIRSDEAGQLGTSLTIAQWIGMITAIICGLSIVLLLRTPKARAWY